MSLKTSPGFEAGWQQLRGWVERKNSIAVRLSFRNITRDKVRFYIAVLGVAFAVLLMSVQCALLIGFATTSSSLIDNAKADIWIAPLGAKNVDQAGHILERQEYVALGTPGVADVESLVVRFAEWKRPDGGTESVIVVGVDPNNSLLRPWNFVAGSPDDLRISDGIVVDELYLKKLGVSHLGESVEVMGRRAKVVGITSGIRTFTQSPYVFTSLDYAKTLSAMPAGRTSYLLVQADPNANLTEVKNALQELLPAANVKTSSAFSWQTRIYWLVTTGAGAALLIATLLGMVVGMVVVSQTLYSATIERHEEFATIRAMGARDRFLKSIILRQALLGGVLGYLIGITGALIFSWFFSNSSAALSLSFSLLFFMAVATLVMCVGASLISIRKVLRIEPSAVFR